MSNRFKEKLQKVVDVLLFRWHDQCKKSLPIYNQDRKKSYKNILTYHIGYVTVKNLSYVNINNVNLL